MAVNVWKAGTFAGETTSVEIAGTLLTDVRHARAKSVPEHAHEVPYFSLLLEGEYSEWSADFAIRYQPYTVVFHDALTPHRDAIAPHGCRMFFVELLPPWHAVVDEQRPLPAHLFEMQGGEPLWLLMRLHREFLARDAASISSVESLVFDLCSYVSAAVHDERAEPEWIPRLETLLTEEFSKPLPLDAVAREIGVHPAHMCRAFRRFRGHTIGDHITGLRIQFVSRMLTQSRAPLGDIATTAGFADQSHMTRTFKRSVGVSPGAYRRSNR